MEPQTAEIATFPLPHTKSQVLPTQKDITPVENPRMEPTNVILQLHVTQTPSKRSGYVKYVADPKICTFY